MDTNLLDLAIDILDAGNLSWQKLAEDDLRQRHALADKFSAQLKWHENAE